MQPITNIVQLRQFLAERLPNLRPLTLVDRTLGAASRQSTGLENLLAGVLAKGSVTEVVGSDTSQGSALLIQWLLCRACELGQWLVLVDGQDCFDPTSLE